MADIILVRHGETDWNREGRFRGRANVRLNQEGLWEADTTAQRIAGSWSPVAIYSSPIERAHQTAQIIAARIIPVLRIVADLADVDYGEWQGLTAAEATKRNPEEMSVFRGMASRARVPGGDAFTDVQRRAVAAILTLATSHERETIVAVSHTEVNRLIILAALGGNIDDIWHVGQGTCAINVLRVTGGVIDVVSINDRCHLDE